MINLIEITVFLRKKWYNLIKNGGVGYARNNYTLLLWGAGAENA